ncbi:MAG: Lsm family RNA-binding protein [Candidatus Helarchaeota archaeon]
MSSTAGSKFFKEMSGLLDAKIKVVTKTKIYEGTLLGFDRNTMSICLSNAEDDEGMDYQKIIIYGDNILELIETGKSFDLKALADDLAKLFPKGEVTYSSEARTIMVLNKIKVTEYGVEGTGPLAERVRQVYERFVEKLESGTISEEEMRID